MANILHNQMLSFEICVCTVPTFHFHSGVRFYLFASLLSI